MTVIFVFGFWMVGSVLLAAAIGRLAHLSKPTVGSKR